jgi:hypothetical protein
MSMSFETSASSEDKRREFVLDFIRQKDVIRSENNLIIVEKAFKINAVLKWCYERAVEKKLTPQLWSKYRTILAQYIAGVVDIQWTENNFEVIEVTNEDKEISTTRRRTRRRTREDE